MAFSEFTDLDKTAGLLGLRLKRANLFEEAAPVAAPQWLEEQRAFHLARAKRSFSEMFAREFLIAPVFTFAQMRRARLNLFSSDFRLEGAWPHQPALHGVPDYLVAYPVEEGALDSASQFPLLAVAEAKNETFNAGWAQCAAELFVCRQLNEKAGENGGVSLWGIVIPFSVNTRFYLSFKLIQEHSGGFIEAVFLENRFPTGGWRMKMV